MKKTMSFILALMTALTLICTAALADSVPQPEGGKKFESNWGMMCGLIEIVYEEEGYRVSVDLYNQAENTGTQWEYSCYYNEQKDILESISSRKIGYALNLLTMVKAYGEYEYDAWTTKTKPPFFPCRRTARCAGQTGMKTWARIWNSGTSAVSAACGRMRKRPSTRSFIGRGSSMRICTAIPSSWPAAKRIFI